MFLKIPVLLTTLGCVFGGCQSTHADIDESINNEEIELEDKLQPKIDELNFGPNPGD